MHIRTKFLNALIIVFLFLTWINPVQATVVTGDALTNMCISKKERDLFSCQSYIAGIVDYHVLIKSLGTAPSVDFCIPENATMDDMRLIVVEYLRNNQQHSSFVASPAVALALFEVFPCTK